MTFQIARSLTQFQQVPALYVAYSTHKYFPYSRTKQEPRCVDLCLCFICNITSQTSRLYPHIKDICVYMNTTF